jgi:thiosulfate dehydrogenase (quinone) large subunit
MSTTMQIGLKTIVLATKGLSIMNVLRTLEPRTVSYIPPLPLARFLFTDTRMSWLWLLLRLYVGYQWLTSGWEKLTGCSITFESFGKVAEGGPWLLTGHDGKSIYSFVHNALAHAGGVHPSVQTWYAAFLQHVVLPNATVFAYLISLGEFLVGIGLLLGAFTGVAALFGVFMNMNYMLAGSLSINPILTIAGILLVLAWRISGYYGLDRWLLPLLLIPRLAPSHESMIQPTPQNKLTPTITGDDGPSA